MQLNDLLKLHGIDTSKVIVVRHKPTAAELNDLLPQWAEDKPDIFNCYQQTQGPVLEKAMLRLRGEGYIASFIGQSPGKATFVGLYKIAGSRSITSDEFSKIPEHQLLGKLGSTSFGASEPRKTIEFFDLVLDLDFYPIWKGRLIIDWPQLERSWWRRAERNVMPVSAILDESAFVANIPAWQDVNLNWTQLKNLTATRRNVFSQWRGIYFIHDASDGRGYVGSAYGETNLLGRWLGYSKTGHGGNSLLKGRNPENFRFSILQLLAHDHDPTDVIRIENSWKERLHTRKPHGLNEN